MSYLPSSKHGDCTKCPAKDTACVKVGKELICIKCNNAGKTKKQIFKAKQRNLNNLSKKVKSFAKGEDAFRDGGKSKSELGKWFEERRKEMSGKCHHCNGVSCKHDDKYYKFSICHILPKAYFPSVATHEYNWIELCFWNNNCHGNMDNKILDLIEMNCWDEIVTKFCIIYPFIAKEERRRVPEILLQYIEVEK